MPKKEEDPKTNRIWTVGLIVIILAGIISGAAVAISGSLNEKDKDNDEALEASIESLESKVDALRNEVAESNASDDQDAEDPSGDGDIVTRQIDPDIENALNPATVEVGDVFGGLEVISVDPSVASNAALNADTFDGLDAIIEFEGTTQVTGTLSYTPRGLSDIVFLTLDAEEISNVLPLLVNTQSNPLSIRLTDGSDTNAEIAATLGLPANGGTKAATITIDDLKIGRSFYSWDMAAELVDVE